MQISSPDSPSTPMPRHDGRWWNAASAVSLVPALAGWLQCGARPPSPHSTFGSELPSTTRRRQKKKVPFIRAISNPSTGYSTALSVTSNRRGYKGTHRGHILPCPAINRRLSSWHPVRHPVRHPSKSSNPPRRTAGLRPTSSQWRIYEAAPRCEAPETNCKYTAPPPGHRP